MDTFDGSEPNLISSKTLADIESKLNNAFDTNDSDNGNRVINGLGSFYTNYVTPNMFPLIVIALLIFYLVIRYILKKDREERELNEDPAEGNNTVGEKVMKRVKTKKQMVYIDPDDALHTKKNTDTDVMGFAQLSSAHKKEPDISDLISDDYLLTNDSDESEEVNDQTENPSTSNLIDPLGQKPPDMTLIDMDLQLQPSRVSSNGARPRETVFDVEKAAELVFGKGK